MFTPRRTNAAAVILVAALAGTRARADLPPPDGMTRVEYVFRVDAVPAGTTLVGFPTYNLDDNGSSVVVLVAGKDVRSVQGYRPGIHALAAADAAGLPREQQAIAAYLKAKGRPCLKEVPRVFQVATSTGITKMTDVIHVDASPGRCSASLVNTIYEGPGGQRGEGGVDAEGNRRPPAPFGSKDVPDVTQSGFATASTPVTPAIAGAPTSASPAPATPPASPEAPRTAGCSVAPSSAGPWLLAVPIVLLARRRRSIAVRR